jgi:serine/threonine-protein kinase
MQEQFGNIGRYAVTAELGRGSMGVVHLAHDPVMSRDLAIKTIVLPYGLPEDQKGEFHARFLREAQAAGRLSHPGIVTVYDFNEAPGPEPPYIAMEYVEGPTLHQIMCDEGALNPDWGMSMAENLADALRVAHESGIVHRDLKPSNILVRESDGVAKIADFGVARVNASELTHAGTVYGSPAYMAPECLQGRPSDRRSDLFSLSVILYEALCGKRPFGGDGYHAICHAITHDPPIPIRQHAPDLSPGFDRFFERALSKDPRRRFQDGAAFREAVRALRVDQQAFGSGAATVSMPTPYDGEPTRPEPGAASRRAVLRRWALIAPAALALMLLSFAAGRGLRGTRPADARRGGLSAPAGEQIGPATVEPPGLTAATESALASGEAAVADGSRVVSPKPIPAGVPEPAAVERFARVEPAVVSPPKAPPSTSATPTTSSAAPTEPASPIAETPVPAGATPAPAEPGDVGTDAVELSAPVGTSAADSAYLELHVKSSIKAGTLTLLVDGEEVYQTELESPESRKVTRAYKKVLGRASQTLDARVRVPAGRHTMVARLFNRSKSHEFENQVEFEIEPGEARSLRVVAGRAIGRRLALKLD